MLDKSKLSDAREELPYDNFAKNFNFYDHLLTSIETSYLWRGFADEAFKHYVCIRDEILRLDLVDDVANGRIISMPVKNVVTKKQTDVAEILRRDIIGQEKGENMIDWVEFLRGLLLARSILIPEGIYFKIQRFFHHVHPDYHSQRFDLTLSQWFAGLEKKFAHILKSHHNFITVPQDEDQWFEYENRSLLQYIQSSLEEIWSYHGNITELSSRQRYAFLVLKRICREFIYASQAQLELHKKIADWVKQKKKQGKSEKSDTTFTRLSQEKSNFNDTREDKALEYIYQCFVRIDNIRTKNYERRTTLWKIIVRKNDSTEELQIMKERLNIIQSQYPDLEETCRYISEKIEEIAGIKSLWIEKKSRELMESILQWDDLLQDANSWNNETYEESIITRKTIRSIDRYIQYLGTVWSSTNDTKSNSVWDGLTFNQTILPFLRYMINGIRSGKFSSTSLNISQIFVAFKEDFAHSWSKNGSRLLEVYKEFFMEQNVQGNIVTILPRMTFVLDNIGDFIGWSAHGNRQGCAVITRRSREFFAGPEWKKIVREFPKDSIQN